MLTIEIFPVDSETPPVLDTPKPFAPPLQDDGSDEEEEEEDDNAEDDQNEEDDDDDFGDDFDDFEEGDAGEDDFDDFEASFQQPEVSSAPTPTALPPQQASLPFVSFIKPMLVSPSNMCRSLYLTLMGWTQIASFRLQKNI